MNIDVKRGDIFYIKSMGQKTIGNEQTANRPALVYNFHKESQRAIILYITTKQNKRHVPIQTCIVAPSYVICNQIYTVSIYRIGQKMGHVTEKEQAEIDKRLLHELGFGKMDEIEKKFQSFW